MIIKSLVALLMTLFTMAFSASAIVIRHDVKDAKYLATTKDFPPLATFYIDGAHGTLVKPNWIVTAAHATFCVAAGTFVMINDKPRKVVNVFVHSGYTPGQSHDIALVQLAENVTDVIPAQAYTQSDESGKIIWFIGIGGTGNGLQGQTVDNAANNGILRKAQNTVKAAQGPLITFTFDQGKQALPLEGVSGAGDSGGPAFTATSGKFQLLGISSRPQGRFARVGEYGITEVYTRVSFFKDWMQQVIDGNAAQRTKISTNKLKQLPAGLNDDNLAGVCQQIGVGGLSID